MDKSNETPAVDVRDLRMRYGTKDVLTGVTFTAQRGEVLALLGPNGAGKTTTIEILEGFRVRSAGHVSVLGTDPARADEAWRARIGVVLQSWRDHKFWRVRELLAYQARFYAPFATAEVARPWDVDELIDVVGLSESAHAKIMTLSGGQRRRLDVAIGIVGRPEIVFLRRTHRGLRSACTSRLPRSHPPAVRLREHDHPDDDSRPGRGREDRRPDSRARRGADRRRRQCRPARPRAHDRRRSALDLRWTTPRARRARGRPERLRPRPADQEPGRHRARSAPRESRGHLHGTRPARRVGPVARRRSPTRPPRKPEVQA